MTHTHTCHHVTYNSPKLHVCTDELPSSTAELKYVHIYARVQCALTAVPVVAVIMHIPTLMIFSFSAVV